MESLAAALLNHKTVGQAYFKGTKLPQPNGEGVGCSIDSWAKTFLVKRKLLPSKGPMNNHFLKLCLLTKARPQPKTPLESAMPCLRTRPLKCQARSSISSTQQVLPQPSPCLGRSLSLYGSKRLPYKHPAYTVVIHPQCGL